MKKGSLKKWIFRGLVILLTLFLALGAVVMGGGYNLYQTAIKRLPIETAVHAIESTSEFVPYEELDEDYLNAVVAIEDHRFYTRYGLDFYALARATITNILSGGIKEGGSTITQQLAKNIYFTNSKNILRKVAEFYFVYALEDVYSKEEILSLYVNIIYFGDGYYGINAASQGYLGKDPTELTVYEASLLAGFPQSPSNYQLSNGYTLINERQREVLDAMLEYGYITELEYEKALAQQPEE